MIKDDIKAALEVGLPSRLKDALTRALAEIERLEGGLAAKQHDNDQAQEAIATLNAGKPLGPIVGYHLIENQARHIANIEEQLDEAMAALKEIYASVGQGGSAHDIYQRVRPIASAAIAKGAQHE